MQKAEIYFFLLEICFPKLIFLNKNTYFRPFVLKILEEVKAHAYFYQKKQIQMWFHSATCILTIEFRYGTIRLR